MTKQRETAESSGRPGGSLSGGTGTDTEEFEKAVYEGRYNEAFDLLADLLESIDGGALMNSDTDSELVGSCTRIAAAVTALFANPSSQPTAAPYRRITRMNPTLTALFACSAFGDADHMLHMVSEQFQRSQQPGPPDLMKLLASVTLETDADIDLSRFISAAPDIALPAYFGMLGAQVLLTERSYERRKLLLRLGPVLGNHVPEFENLYHMVQPWFNCSYDDSPDKHSIKTNLNEVMKKSMESIGVRSLNLSAVRRLPQRPTIVIPMERFGSHHAVYRCYAPSIRQLKDHFDLVLLCDPGVVDDRSRALFDRVLQLDFTPGGLRRAIADLEKLAPDIVYYPSVGMSVRIIALANLRIAPIQIMSMGHPATTNADTIDYVAIEERYLGDPELFSETVLCLADGSCQFEKRHDMKSVTPIIREHADPIRISVPSTPFKLNPTYMATCQKIAQRSERRVEFCFFPNREGLMLHHIRKRIRGWLPEATVFRRSDYNTYITNLNSCDLQLISFPFGGTNSSMDALRQGIPIVTLEGDEVHSRGDAGFIRHMGAPDWLIADSHEAYVEAALRLIHDDRGRVAISRQILEADVDSQYHDWRYETHPKDFVALFKWLYENHEAVQADGRKVWRRGDRAEAVQADGRKVWRRADRAEAVQ